MKILPLAFAALAISSPAAAVTMEQVATAAGQLAAGYARARFLCLAAGIEMPTLAALDPASASAYSDLKARYSDFYDLGARKGVAQANRMLSDPRDVPFECDGYKNRATPKK